MLLPARRTGGVFGLPSGMEMVELVVAKSYVGV
jgi:hypothetical protein